MAEDFRTPHKCTPLGAHAAPSHFLRRAAQSGPVGRQPRHSTDRGHVPLLQGSRREPPRRHHLFHAHTRSTGVRRREVRKEKAKPDHPLTAVDENRVQRPRKRRKGHIVAGVPHRSAVASHGPLCAQPGIDAIQPLSERGQCSSQGRAEPRGGCSHCPIPAQQPVLDGVCVLLCKALSGSGKEQGTVLLHHLLHKPLALQSGLRSCCGTGDSATHRHRRRGISNLEQAMQQNMTMNMTTKGAYVWARG